MKHVLTLLTIVMLGLAAVPVSAQSQADLDDVDALRDAGRFEAAMDRLTALIDEHGESAALLWRIAWTRVDIGERTDDARRQERLYRQAADEARRAVEIDPGDAWAHMVRGIAVGRAALLAGTREKVELSREVRESADEAIRLDPTLDGAYHVRGRWHHEVASLGFFARSAVRLVYGGLPDASYESAVDDFMEAIRLEDRVVHRLELGRTLIELRNHAEARVHLERAVSMDDDDPSAPLYRDEARELLQSLR
jgi:tetratricopeptide (TPR) repeat protein